MKKIILSFLTVSLLAGFQPSYGALNVTTVGFTLSAATSLWVMLGVCCGGSRDGKDATKQFRAGGAGLVVSLGGLAWSVWNGREKKSETGGLRGAARRRMGAVWWQGGKS